jgi:tetratricopeptide (TPR) repeat protein
MENSKPNNSKTAAPKPVPAKPAAPAAPAAPVKVPPMFRAIDWMTLAITFGIIWAIYLFTLAPEQTLEDSGELCTGAFYAGIPHPPGYPFWSVYAWFWTWILPIGNVAWRVEVGQSFAAAMGCGLLALMVSRGGSMLIEGIDEIKGLPRRWENSICIISGCVAGILLGLDIFMWSESVVINRISVFGVPWLIAVMVCLMRWMYAPQQRRYLYLAMLLYGLCATIHQTLLLSAMGVEVAIALAHPKLGRDMFIVNSLFYIGGLMCMNTIPALHNMTGIEQALFHVVGLGSLVAAGWLAIETKGFLTEWKTILFMGIAWAVGVSCYFYEPVSGMTVPPMQWGYPRTVEGFFHALSRGQYENVQGLDIFSNPGRFGFQLWYIVTGLAESFSWVYLFVGVLPFLFLLKMRRREKSWIIGVTCIYFCLAVLLGILLNVSPDRSSSDLNKVFYTASHGLFALMIGYGLTLLAAYVATHYANFRRWGIVGSVVAIVLALYCLKDATGKLFFGPAGDISLFKLPHYIALAFAPGQYGLPVFANLILLAIPVLLLGALLVYRHRGPVLILLCLFTAMPLWSGLSHWYNSEQRNHWFGYWFGHDMFTPPFQDNGRLSYDNARRAALLKDPKNARLIYPEMTRNTILFGGTDPGRFCPTYAIFCDSFIPHRCQPEQDQKFDRRDVYLITQNALADGTYLDYLRSQYNRSKQIDPPFFSELSKYFFTLFLGPDNADTGLTGFVNNTLFNVLDRPFTAWGAYVEKRRRAEGVYPTSEIYIPSPEDSQRSFEEYARQKQLTTTDGRIQISGQVDVMNINGLLCKVIFDNNPTNEFYVEESFPLDWMYPYETPFGIIMKINRNLQPELSQDVFDLDHKFWTDFSPRLCGNWITYDTTVQQIADFVERTYIQNNYQGYTGDHAFVRDNDAQKAFSKLRSSQAGMYAWRCFPHSPQNPVGCPPEFVQKSAASQAALIRETDFAFKQAFAFCPYSPEAVYRYVNFLMQRAQAAEMSGQMDQAVRHFDDAILIAKTCKKLDPYNDSITGLIKTVQDYKQQFTGHAQAVNQIDQLENTARTNPGDIHNLITLGGTYMQMQQTNRAEELFSQALDTPGLKFNEAAAIAQYFNFIGNYPKLETALEKLAALAPGQPEPLYDLAALQTVLGSNTEAMKNLKQALDWSNQRRKLNPQASDLTASNRTDRRFDRLRPLPEFQKLLAPN